MSTPRVRDARSEADALLGDQYEARVLEPSPPADMSDPVIPRYDLYAGELSDWVNQKWTEMVTE